MPDTVTTVIAGLTTSAVAALTAIAYKHPLGFKKIFYVLQPMLVIALAASWIWNTSTVMAGHGVIRSQCCKGVDTDVIYAAAQTYEVPTWAFVGIVALILYLALLLYLPSILEETGK